MTRRQQRQGAILPMVALGIIGLLGCVALAIDIGMIATARTQTQNVADLAAMAGARTLDGDSANNNNFDDADDNALAAVADNLIFNASVNPANVSIEVGSYTYNETLKKFEILIPKDANDNNNLVKATVSFSNGTAFAKIWGINAFNVQTTATAAHRPRDLVVIVDHSGSMRFDSLLGIPYTGNRTQSANPEDNYPVFGHYSYEAGAALQADPNQTYYTLGSTIYGQANISVTTDAGKPIIEDFYQHTAGSAKQAAFTAANLSYSTTPGGDNFLFKPNSSTNYAQNIQDIIGASTAAQGSSAADPHAWDGYTDPPYLGYTGSTVKEFAGYTEGPRYWGKTFWIWPPDPRPANDWRIKFFNTDDNTDLYNSSGQWRESTNTNYTAILAWIKSDPNPFPNRLRAGRILYYDEIPDDVSGAGTGSQTARNKKFWREYIDYVVGDNVQVGRTGYGDDFNWGSRRITAPHSGDRNGRIINFYSQGYTGWLDARDWDRPEEGHRVMIKHNNPDGSLNVTRWYTVIDTNGNNIKLDRGLDENIPDTGPGDPSNVQVSQDVTCPYFDNPQRPKLHFWFGPMTMVDFLGNYNTNQFLWPGTCHEAPLYTQKLGIRAALTDIQINHPNDNVGLVMFSSPKYSSGGGGQFNRARAGLGREYQRMIDGLFYPPDTITDNLGTPGADISPWSSENDETPRSTGSTSPAMAFMLAYNQFSTHSATKTWTGVPEGEAGGNGRKGSQKMIIFLTDGVANTKASATFVNGGSHNCYYRCRAGTTTEYPGSPGGGTADQLYGIVDRVVALETASSPGYSTARKPVLIHSLAFGTLFEPTTSSSDKSLALGILQNVAYRGNTLASASTPLPAGNTITGTSSERVDKLKAAFKAIMQDGVQVTLLE